MKETETLEIDFEDLHHLAASIREWTQDPDLDPDLRAECDVALEAIGRCTPDEATHPACGQALTRFFTSARVQRLVHLANLYTDLGAAQDPEDMRLVLAELLPLMPALHLWGLRMLVLEAAADAHPAPAGLQ